jgi:hypothetical protein
LGPCKKSNLPIQASESSMPQAFESDFPNFRVLVKIKFSAATMPQAFETDFPIFLGPCKKLNLPMPQRHKELRAINYLQELVSK